MKIDAGSMPPASASVTPENESMRLSPKINRYSGTIAAAPVITEESNSSM